jgi:hypothetical protein
MNILKAADDIKNFSDQQLLSAGENPVMLPPYLVLAEMKRREQMRAEFAKSQQQQQPPTVIQQTAQNLAQSQQQQGQPQQGQPQQGMPQQPQAQGIMQGAPQQVMAMASGGYVPRYAAGTTNYSDTLKFFNDQIKALAPTSKAPTQAPPSLAMSNEDIAKRYPDKPLAGYIDEMRSAYGPRDYSAEKKLIELQTQLAESKKPRVGDALLELASVLGGNQDPKVGLTGLFTKGIVAASKSYDAAKDNQNKLRSGNLAMMAALQRQQQKDSDDMIGKAMESKRSDIGVNLGKLQTIEANIRSTSEALSRADNLRDQQAYQAQLSSLESARAVIIAEHHDRTQLMAASMNNYARNQPKLSPKQVAEERSQDLAANALMYAGDYLRRNPKDKSDRNKLAMDNLFKQKNVGGKEIPAFFEGFDMDDRMRAYGLIQTLIGKETAVKRQNEAMEASKNKANQFGSLGTQINPDDSVLSQYGALK